MKGLVKQSLIIINLLLSAVAFAENVTDYTISDGLSNNKVNCLLVDSRGLLWIGTDNGLNLYNGYKFDVYSHNPDDDFSISNNTVNSISQDSKENIWLATDKGICTYIYQLEYFKPLVIPNWKDSLEYYSNHKVFQVSVDSLDNIFYFTQEVFVKLRNDGQLIDIVYLNQNDSYDNASIVLDQKGGAYLYNSKVLYALGSTLFDKKKITLPDSKYNQLLNVINGEMVFSKGSYIVSYDPLTRFEKHIDVIEAGTKIFVLGAQTFVKYYNEELYIDQALNLLNTNYKSQLHVQKLNHLAIDHSGVFWLGTDFGLVKFNPHNSRFESLKFKNKDFKDENVQILSILKIKHYLIAGTKEYGLIVYNELTRQYEFKHSQLKNIRAIHSSGNKHIYLATNNGVWFFNKDSVDDITNLSEQLAAEEHPFKDSLNCEIYTLAEDQSNNLWICAAKGLYKYNTEQSTLHKQSYKIGDSSTKRIVYTLAFYEQDKLFLGTDKGVKVVSKNFMYSSEVEELNQHLFRHLNNSVFCIARDTVGYYWIGTANGLYKCSQDMKTFERFSREDGLQSDYIVSIAMGKKGEFWLATNKGLIQFNPYTKNSFNYGIADGVADLNFNINTVYTVPTGQIYFGGSNLTWFKPEQVAFSKRIPKTIIASVKKYNTSESINMHISTGDTIVVNYNRDNIVVELAADDLSDPKKNLFRYSYTKINATPDWSVTDFDNIILLPRTPPGRYIFRARALSNNDSSNNTEVNFQVFVKAPFVQSKLAYSIYIALFAFIVYLVFRYRTRKLRQANRIYKEREAVAREIARQKEELTIQNNNIKASINYAKRIQQAMMPSEKHFKSVLPNSFIYHHPKDIVSGDFYWISRNNDRIYVAAVDCTGHGVPGAFMSIIGVELFRRITKIPGILPSEVLDRLNEEFAIIFKDVDSVTLRDGMDVALGIIDEKEQIIEYAGAFNPLYIIRNNKITETKADRFSVGLEDMREISHHFNYHKIKYEKGDMIYLFSDGYVDQFGGPEGKKFKYRRFRHLLLTLHKLPLEKQREFLVKAITDWRGDYDQVDDILIIGIRL